MDASQERLNDEFNLGKARKTQKMVDFLSEVCYNGGMGQSKSTSVNSKNHKSNQKQGERQSEKSTKSEKATVILPNAALRSLIVMATLMTMTMIVANLAATKIWSFFGIPFDAGILLFPLSYILGDLLAEIYGRKTADFVATAGAMTGILTVIFMLLAKLLPDYAGADNSSFVVITEATGRVFAASIVGFLAGQVVNNYIFERRRYAGKSFMDSALVSSMIAHLPDILLFEPIAFWGRLSMQEFMLQAVVAYGVAILIEMVLLFSVTDRLAALMVKKLQFKDGKPLTDGED